jgi:hypothetical protein
MITLLFNLILLGILLGLFCSFQIIPQWIKTIVSGICMIVALVWVAGLFGLTRSRHTAWVMKEMRDE